MTTVKQFVEGLKAPTLTRVEGVELETDDRFRERILQLCARISIPVVVYATGEQLDAIGFLNGLVRKGMRL